MSTRLFSDVNPAGLVPASAAAKMSAMLSRRLIWPALLLCTLGLSSCNGVIITGQDASVFYLSPEGDDAQDGLSESTAWATWSHAVPSLIPGDTLIVLPGTYSLEDSIVIDNLPASTDQPTRIVSKEPGKAVLRLEPRIGADWEQIEPNLFRLPFEGGQNIACAFLGDLYLHNYRSLPDLLAARNKTEGYHQGGQYYDGPPEGLAYDENHLYLKLPEGTSPEGLQLVRSTSPVVAIKHSPDLVFDGFTLQGGSTAMTIDQESQAVTVRNCVIRGASYGVMTDADHTLVEWCEFTVPGLEAFNDALMQRGTYIYYFMKDRGLEGGLVYSRKVPSPRYLEARYNSIHNVFDGDGLGQFDDSSIHHSRYHNCFDNAVEFEPNVKGKRGANLRFYQNRVDGFSRGYLSHQQNGVNREQATAGRWLMEGPHYVHHNVIIADGDNRNGWKPWTVIKSRPWNSDIKIHYAHNLIYARTRADLFWSLPEWEAGLANMSWENNVILLPEGNAEIPTPFQGRCNVLFAPQPNQNLTGIGGLHITTIDALCYPDNAPERYPQPLAGTILANRSVAQDEPWMLGLQNTTVGPFVPGETLSPDWPRPITTTFAPR